MGAQIRFVVNGLISLSIIGVATGIAMKLAMLGVEAPYILYLPAVVLCLMAGGTVAALGGLVCAGIATWFFFVPPVWSFQIENLQSALTLLLFFAVTGFIGEVLYRQHKRIAELSLAYTQMHDRVAHIHKELLGRR